MGKKIMELYQAYMAGRIAEAEFRGRILLDYHKSLDPDKPGDGWQGYEQIWKIVSPAFYERTNDNFEGLIRAYETDEKLRRNFVY